MRQANRYILEPKFLGSAPRPPIQVHQGSTSVISEGLNLSPADSFCPRSQGLHHRLLGREADRQGLTLVSTEHKLLISVYPIQKTSPPTGYRLLNSTYFYYVYSNAMHFCSAGPVLILSKDFLR